MQRMKEMEDTGYQRGKMEHIRRQEAERIASLTQEQALAAEEERIRQEILADQNRAKLTDLNEEKQYEVSNTLQPKERSFLIQPDKSPKARLPSIFSANNMSPTESSPKISPKNQSNANFKENANQEIYDGNQQTMMPGSSNQSFAMNDSNQFGFGKRSHSVAAPNLGLPSTGKHIDLKGESFAL